MVLRGINQPTMESISALLIEDAYIYLLRANARMSRIKGEETGRKLDTKRKEMQVERLMWNILQAHIRSHTWETRAEYKYWNGSLQLETLMCPCMRGGKTQWIYECVRVSAVHKSHRAIPTWAVMKQYTTSEIKETKRKEKKKKIMKISIKIHESVSHSVR